MAARIDVSQDIKTQDPFNQEAKPNSDLTSKVGQKGAGFALPPGILSEEAEGKGKGKGPGEGPGKAPGKDRPWFLKEGGEGLKSPFEHFGD
jgi:hypothetical protein